jgi:hypothetical protein
MKQVCRLIHPGAWDIDPTPGQRDPGNAVLALTFARPQNWLVLA